MALLNSEGLYLTQTGWIIFKRLCHTRVWRSQLHHTHLDFSWEFIIFRYTEDNIPSHPCLELLANSEQVLTKRIGRRLITMQKNSPYQVSNLLRIRFPAHPQCHIYSCSMASYQIIDIVVTKIVFNSTLKCDLRFCSDFWSNFRISDNVSLEWI